MTHASSMHDAGQSRLELWDNVRDRVGREVGRGLKNEGDMCTYEQFMLIYGKNHHNVVKYLLRNKSSPAAQFKTIPALPYLNHLIHQ